MLSLILGKVKFSRRVNVNSFRCFMRESMGKCYQDSLGTRDVDSSILIPDDYSFCLLINSLSFD